MPQNFLECDREQAFLMPPDPRDWLPEGHLAWFVLAAVEQMDLSAFYAAYRVDGWGRAAFEPEMMLSLLLYPGSTDRLAGWRDSVCRGVVAVREAAWTCA